MLPPGTDIPADGLNDLGPDIAEGASDIRLNSDGTTLGAEGGNGDGDAYCGGWGGRQDAIPPILASSSLISARCHKMPPSLTLGPAPSSALSALRVQRMGPGPAAALEFTSVGCMPPGVDAIAGVGGDVPGTDGLIELVEPAAARMLGGIPSSASTLGEGGGPLSSSSALAARPRVPSLALLPIVLSACGATVLGVPTLLVLELLLLAVLASLVPLVVSDASGVGLARSASS